MTHTCPEGDEMKCCENCHHWNRHPRSGEIEKDDYRNFHHTKVCGAVGMGSDQQIYEGGEGYELASDDKAFAHDGSDYIAYLTTAPDFYCNQHKPSTTP
ncbi:MAG: hypothetical protein AAGB19_14450 [Cyanobacteria bacterium P01_F01_bin.3]